MNDRYTYDGVDEADLPDWHPERFDYVEPNQPAGLSEEDEAMAMKFPVNGGGGDFKRAPAGSHLAVCNLVADVGLQPGSRMYPSPKHKIYLRFEIPAERVEYEKDGKKVEGPLTIGSFYTASMNEKATLRKHLEGWRGRGFTDAQAADFDVATVLGKPCMLSVVESEEGGKVYSNIASISAIPKGVTAPAAENPLLFYDTENDSAYERLPKWLRDKIDSQLSPEAAKPAPETELHRADRHGEAFEEDDIPF